MNCPVCREAMIVLELDRAEIDHCVSCKGIWLDRGELELILEGTPEKNDVLSSFGVDHDSREKRRKCPICLRKMEKVICGIGEKVRIDRCPKNDGLWFDLGELYEIVKMGHFGGSTKVLVLLKDVFGKEIESKEGGIR